MDTIFLTWTNARSPAKQRDSTFVAHFCRRLIYTVENDTRIQFAEVPANDLDLSLCQGDVYPVLEDRQGYMHSFAMTENYIILPETSMLFEPCNRFGKM